MSGERPQSGFTLLELLVVITVLGLLLVALTNGVRFAGQAWELQQRRSERRGDLDAVQNLLRQMIASATRFESKAAELHFVTQMPMALARAGLYDATLRRSGDDLILSWTPHFTGPAPRPSQTDAVLAHGVTMFAVDYYMEPGGWRPAIDDKTKQPSLIRIGLQTANGNTWPSLVVAPAIELQPTATK